MHDDPTRTMGQPEHPGTPGGGRPHGNVRLLIAGLIAVIVGLVAAIFVIAADSGNDTSTVTLPTAVETTATAPTTTGSTTSDSTSTETTAPPSTATTGTTTTTPTTPEEETGSGGIPAR